MDVFLQKLANSILFTSVKSEPVEKTKRQRPVLLASGSSRSPSGCRTTPSPSSSGALLLEQPQDLPRRRIANWDKKREKCQNCQLIYLKTLSLHPGYCSVDCKSNMDYLEKVNCTIRAMKNAVLEQRQLEPQQCEERQQFSNDDNVSVVHNECKTFAEFGIESRILDTSNVVWAFSAMY